MQRSDKWKIYEADASLVQDDGLASILTDQERERIFEQVENDVIGDIDSHIKRLKKEWDRDSPPDEYFDEFEAALSDFVEALAPRGNFKSALVQVKAAISRAVSEMEDDYQPSPSTSAPTSLSTPQATGLSALFRDIDD